MTRQRDKLVIYDGSDGKHKPGEIECLGCHKTEMLPLPIPIGDIVKLERRMRRQHRDCSLKTGSHE